IVAGYTVHDGNGGADYTVATATATGTITPHTLSIVPLSDSRQYNGTTSSSLSPTVTGLQGTDTAPATQAFQSKNVLGAGNSTLVVAGYTVNDGNSGANYTVTANGTTAGTITPHALTIAPVTDTKVYDGTTSSSASPMATGLQGTDTVAASQAFQSKDVLGAGNSTLVVAIFTILDGNLGINYTVTASATATGTISTRAITVT